MRFRWDNKKNQLLTIKRGLDFEIIVQLFERSYHLSRKYDDPEQWRAIGWVNSRLITVIYEEREDQDGPFYWFVTAWIATKTEEKLFNES